MSRLTLSEQAEWSARRCRSLLVADHLEKAYPAVASRIRTCTPMLERSAAGYLYPRESCQHRLCALCRGRPNRSLQRMATGCEVLIAADPKIGILHSVFTVANCPPEQLGGSVDSLVHGVQSLQTTRLFPSCWKLEVTRAGDGRLHPHLHRLSAAPLSTNTADLIEEQTERFISGARLDCRPQTSCEFVDPLPIGRYLVTSHVDVTNELAADSCAVVALAAALYKRRLANFSHGWPAERPRPKIASYQEPAARYIWRPNQGYMPTPQ